MPPKKGIVLNPDSLFQCLQCFEERYYDCLTEADYKVLNNTVKHFLTNRQAQPAGFNLSIVNTQKNVDVPQTIIDLQGFRNHTTIRCVYDDSRNRITTFLPSPISDSEKVTIIGQQFSDASTQSRLHELSRLPFVSKVSGMPDLHMAHPCPVGTTLTVYRHVYPKLIGDDIGCGVSLFCLREPLSYIRDHQELTTTIRERYAQQQINSGRLNNLREQYGVITEAFNFELGTIGGGNHFVELMYIDQLYEESFASTLSTEAVYVCAHSGSRQYGVEIQAKTSMEVLTMGTKELQQFLQAHDDGLRFAACNRQLIAERFCAASNDLVHLGPKLFDVAHNFVEAQGSNFIHRKGAIPSNRGPVMIPGSRGAASYLVYLKEGQTTEINSLPHGAGRSITRSQAKEIFSNLTRAEMETTEIGSSVICDSDSLLKQEHPQVYKDIDAIMASLQEDYGVTVIARFLPLITVKM